MINTQNFQLCLLIKSMFCCLVLRRGCLFEKPNFAVADHHHHVEQDVWRGITCFINFPPCVCVCIGFIYQIPFYILFEGGHVSLRCSEKKVFYLLKMDYLFLFLLKCVCIHAHVSMCARWPSFPCLVIFHWSILPPPSQIAPSPLMLHNLSSQPVFDEMSQQQYIREPRSKTSGNDLY